MSIHTVKLPAENKLEVLGNNPQAGHGDNVPPCFYFCGRDLCVHLHSDVDAPAIGNMQNTDTSLERSRAWKSRTDAGTKPDLA